MMLDRLIALTDAYHSLFSVRRDSDSLSYFSDDLIPDMYDHNFIRVRDPGVNPVGLLRDILAEAARAKRPFVHVAFMPGAALPAGLQTEAGELGFVPSCLLHMAIAVGSGMTGAEHPKCQVLRANSAAHVTDALACQMEYDAGFISPGFSERKWNRKAQMLSDARYSLYLCRVQGKTVGACEWFVHGDMVKIEDFVVLTPYQRQGFGTAMLRAMIHDAGGAGARYLCLTTDADDTAQSMYCKAGLAEVAREQRFFALSPGSGWE